MSAHGALPQRAFEGIDFGTKVKFQGEATLRACDLELLCPKVAGPKVVHLKVLGQTNLKFALFCWA